MLRRSHKCHGLGRDLVRLRQDPEIVSIRLDPSPATGVGALPVVVALLPSTRNSRE
jgi:hypothetical protein